MAIGTDASIDFFGTADNLDSSTSAVTSAAWSVVADMPAWTNDDDAKGAAITFEGTLGATAAAGKSIDLYVRRINTIDTTDDDSAINDEFPHKFLCSFTMDEDTAQRYTVNIALPNYKTSSEFEFYIYNGSGQTLSSGWKMLITPMAIGPHA